MFALRFLAISTLLAPFLSDEVLRSKGATDSAFQTRRPSSPSPVPFPQFDRKQLTATAKEQKNEKDSSVVSRCYCDDLCLVYNDCCPVLAPNFNGSTDIVEPLPAEVITCRNFERLNSRYSVDDDVYVVDRCPNSHGDADEIRVSCKKSETSLEPFYRLPVIGNRSGILYGNVYCAVCNGEPEVVYWMVGKKELLLLSANDVNAARYVFVNPKGQTLRGCVADQTQRRGSSDSGQNKRRKCRYGSESPFYSYEYKNVDLIHSQPFPVCEINRSRSENLKLVCHDEYNTPNGESVLPSQPYSVIFDLNSRTIRANENQMNGDGNIMRDCDHGMLYDPFVGICRQIYCQPGSKLTSTGCSVERPHVDSIGSFDHHPVQSIVSNDSSCYCDPLCLVYNDCCPVLAPNFNGLTDIVKPLPAEVITCRNFNRSQCANPADDDDDVYVVSRCPNSHDDDDDADEIRKGCKLSETSLEPFYRLPVTGNRSGILYGNVYCAVCNGEPEVVFWMVNKERSFRTNDVTVERYVFVKPKGQMLRSCVADQTQRRGSNDSCQTENGKCPDGSQSHLYKYEYEEDELIHSQPFPVCEIDPKHLHRWCRVKYLLPIQPYSVIFDLNSRTIREISENENHMNGDWNFGLEQEAIIRPMRDCDYGMQYDPFVHVCRQIHCRLGFQLTSTGCSVGRSRVNSPGPVGQNFPPGQLIDPDDTKHLNCTQMIRLNDSEFTLLSNNSAFVHEIGSYYDPDEYIFHRPHLYICSDFIGNDTTKNIAPPVFHFDRVQIIVSFVGILISLVALTIQFVIYMVFPDLRNTPGKCVVCLILSIFSGQLSFLFVGYTGPGCRYLAAFMHFAILASFCWMNVLALDISKTFASSRMVASRLGSGAKRFLAYSVYAWLLPATIVGMCLTMDVLGLHVRFRPYYGEGVCWITSRMGLVVFFLVPVALILLSNFILFGITVFCLRRSSKASESVLDKSRSKGQLILYFRLSVIMGLTWVFGFIATLTQWTVVWYLFILFNTLKGAFLCIAFVCTKNVLNMMKSRTTPISGSSLVPGTEHETPPAVK